MITDKINKQFEEIIKSQDILNKLNEFNFKKPTLVQKKAIPQINEDKDAIVTSKTGSGKTLVFLQHILNVTKPYKGIQSLVLLPTNELCRQVYEEFLKFNTLDNLNILELNSHKSIKSQIEKLDNTNILIATTGRMLELQAKNPINFENLKVLVLDEADQLLHSIFLEQVETIIQLLPGTRQTLMFSATINKRIQKFSQKYMKKDRANIIAEKYIDEKKLSQIHYNVEDKQKLSLLSHIIKYHSFGLMIIFTNRQDSCEFIEKNLMRLVKDEKLSLKINSIHSGLAQNKRSKIVDEFKQEKFDILVATDVAARGMDIDDISHIINYNIPKFDEKYIHRIGRTARQDKSGSVINFVTKKDEINFNKILEIHNLNSVQKSLPDFDEIEIKVDYKKHREKRHLRKSKPQTEKHTQNKTETKIKQSNTKPTKN